MENELLLAGYKKRRSRSDTGWLEEWHKEERRSWYGTYWRTPEVALRVAYAHFNDR